MADRDLGSVADLFAGAPGPRPAASTDAFKPQVAASPATPAPRRNPQRPRSTPTPSPAGVAGTRVYASLPAEHETQVRAIAKARGWSLLAVAAAALEVYPPELYEAERTAHKPSPLPGSKTRMRHGDTYLAMTVNNAEQREWLDTTLAPYRAQAVAHVLGCALSYYVTSAAGRP